MKFDHAAARLAIQFRFRERSDLRDKVWIGDDFQHEVRTSGRLGERRTLRVERNGVFVHLTVGPDVALNEVIELLRTIGEAIEFEFVGEAEGE